MNDNLIDRIDNILHPVNRQRLDFLVVTPEFAQARFLLGRAREILEAGEELSPKRLEYLCAVEKHMKNIHPHIERLTVEGEEHEVLFITKLPECENTQEEH
jgi:hypothetical protein